MSRWGDSLTPGEHQLLAAAGADLPLAGLTGGVTGARTA